MLTTSSLKQKSNSKKEELVLRKNKLVQTTLKTANVQLALMKNMDTKVIMYLTLHFDQKRSNLKKKRKYGKFIVENVHPSFIHNHDGRIDFDSFGKKQTNPFYSAEEINFTSPFPDLILEPDDLDGNLEQQSRMDRGDIQEKICLETENVQPNDDEIPSSKMRYNLRKRKNPDYSEKRPYRKFAKGETSLNSQSASNKSHTNSVENVLPSNCLKAEGKNKNSEDRPIYLNDSDRFYL
jgi:hypothetical protein